MRYRGLDLDPFQADAILALQQQHSVLVSAPTGTGKTVVADWLVEEALGRGQQVVYTAPIKALSNQKFRDYCALFGEEKVGLVTGDLVIRREAPCRVMTTEILRNILLTGEEIPDLAAVIIDEIHFLDDRERGTTWEEVLLYLPPQVLVLGLSATLSNLGEFAAWLEAVRARPVTVIEETRRAVPLYFQVATREGGLLDPREMSHFYTRWARKNAHLIKAAAQPRPGRYGRHGGRDAAPGLKPTRHLDVLRALAPEGLPALYFVFSRRQAESWARQLSRVLPPDGLLSPEERAEVDAALDAFRRDAGPASPLDNELAELYRNGVGFHHAGLHVNLKALVETLYERRLIRVLYCTGTFALGINMPARTAVFEGLERFDGRTMIRLPTREFMQMAGRAGRRGMDEAGRVVVRADILGWEQIQPQLEGYLRGRYEPVRSSFSLSFNSVVNLLERHPPDQIRRLVERSFLAFHRRHRAEDAARRAEALAAAMRADGWEEGGPVPPPLKRRHHELKKLRVEAGTTERTWDELEEKVQFLREIGYLGEDNSFNAGARVLRHIQIQEIFATELFLQGIFEDLSPPVLFGVLCGMCQELPRAAHTAAGREYRGLGRQIEQIRSSDIVNQAERLTRIPTVWDPQMIIFGRWWAEGRSLGELMLNLHSSSDVSGDLVGAFRRARELAAQLRAVWNTMDRGRADAISALIREVSRGEVEVLD